MGDMGDIGGWFPGWWFWWENPMGSESVVAGMVQLDCATNPYSALVKDDIVGMLALIPQVKVTHNSVSSFGLTILSYDRVLVKS